MSGEEGTSTTPAAEVALAEGVEGGPKETLQDGIEKEILQPGTGTKKPKAGDKIEVQYEGFLEADGTKFDSTYDRKKPFSAILGEGRIIDGWEIGIPSMLQGEKAKFTIQPEFAYGEGGNPGAKVPPDATLVFHIELISFFAKGDLFSDEGTLKTVVQEGTSRWDFPKERGDVRLSLRCTSEKGDVLDERTDLDYKMGTDVLGELGSVVDKALQTMSKQERSSVAIVEDYVFKGKGYGRITLELHLQDKYIVSDASFLKDKTVMLMVFEEKKNEDEKPRDTNKVVVKVESATDGCSKAIPEFKGPVEVTFEVGKGEACDALEAAVRHMKRGMKARVATTVAAKAQDAKLGLAEVSAAKVVFTVQLVDIVDDDMGPMDNQDKVDMAVKRKEEGGKLFAAKRWELALEKYKQVTNVYLITHEGFTKEQREKAIEVKRAAELNRGACFMKVGRWNAVVASCDMVLEEDKENIKALYRRGKARHERKEFPDAIKDLEHVLELDPNNSEAKAQLQLAKKAQKKVDAIAQGTFAKMCGGLGTLGAEKRTKKAHVKAAPLEYPPEEMIASDSDDPNHGAEDSD